MAERARRVGAHKKIPAGKILYTILVLLIVGGIGAGAYYLKSRQRPEVPQEPAVRNETPGAVVCRKEQCVLLNTEGVVVKETPRPSGNLLLTIEQEGEALRTGDRPVESAQLEELVFIRQRAAEEFSLHLGRAIQSSQNPGDFTFDTNEGWQLKVSTDNNAYATVGVLARVLEELKDVRLALEYLDLRVENRVYYKIR
jgi:hypothetical protein